MLYLINIVSWVVLVHNYGCNRRYGQILICLDKLNCTRRLLRLFPPSFERSVACAVYASVQILVAMYHGLVPLEFLNHTRIIEKRRYLYRIHISIVDPLCLYCYLLSALHAVVSLVLIVLCINSA